MENTFNVNDEVVRAKGDYVVGRIGTIVALDNEKNRAQVAWVGETKTWVSFSVIEPTSIPYEIRNIQFRKKGYSDPFIRKEYHRL